MSEREKFHDMRAADFEREQYERDDREREIHTIEFTFDPPDEEKEEKLIAYARKLGIKDYLADSANVGGDADYRNPRGA